MRGVTGAKKPRYPIIGTYGRPSAEELEARERVARARARMEITNGALGLNVCPRCGHGDIDARSLEGWCFECSIGAERGNDGEPASISIPPTYGRVRAKALPTATLAFELRVARADLLAEETAGTRAPSIERLREWTTGEYCRECGRGLRSYEAIEAGLGRCCAEKVAS